jgi:hypothetical protein
VYYLGPTITVNPGTNVPFNSDGPLLNITHPIATTVIVVPAGDYLVEYSAFFNFATTASIAIAINGTVDPSTRVASFISTGMLAGQAILSLNAGDQITLRNTGAAPFFLRIAPNVGAQMSLVKLTCI